MPQFVKHTGITITTTILGRIFGLLAAILAARFLGPKGNGYYTLAVLLASTSIALTNFGITTTTIYHIAKEQHLRSEVMGHLFVLNSAVAVLATAAGLIIALYFRSLLFPHTPREYLLLGALIIPGIFTYRFFQNVLLGLQDFKKYNLGQIIFSAIHLLLIGIGVMIPKQKIVGAIVAEAVSWALGAVVFIYWSKLAIPRWSFRLNRSLAKRLFTYGFQSYLGNLLAFFNSRSDVFLLNFFQGAGAVGIYSVAVGLAERLWIISQTASTVLFPRVSSSTDPKWQKRFTPLITRTVLVLVLPVALIIGIFAKPLIVVLYSTKFIDAVLPLQILLFGIVSFSLSRVLAHDIAGRGYPLLNSYTSAISLVVNISLNLLLIPRWGMAGAACAAAASYTSLLISKLVIYQRLSGNSWKEVLLSKKEDWALYAKTLKAIWAKTCRIGKPTQ